MATGSRRVRSFRFASPLVTGEWLAEHAGEVLIAEVRWSPLDASPRHRHAEGHLPGAVLVDLDEDLAGSPSASGGRHPLPDPARFAERMGALGIGDHTPVVAYDTSGGAGAARLWWLLHVLGDPVAVLDGGLAAWPGPRSATPSSPLPRARSVRSWPERRFADAATVARAADQTPTARPRALAGVASRPATGSSAGGDSGAAGRGSTPGAPCPEAILLLDARSALRYAGGDPAIDPRPGHIPGARSAPWTANLDEASGRFRPRVDLRRRYAALGAERASKVIAYCGSGVTACHDLLALELAGFRDAALFPGSWSAWGADPHRPAAEGPDLPGSEGCAPPG